MFFSSDLTSPPSSRTLWTRALVKMWRSVGCVALSFALLGASSIELAHAAPKTHTVYAGQRLGSIAKRYNVTVDELCRANGISASAPIKPGQKLIIPGTDDGKGASKSKDSSKSSNKSSSSPSKPSGSAKIHVVAKGHTLAAISGRYAVTVGAICNANGISRDSALSVGQKLIIPHKDDKNGDYARKQRERGHFKEDTKDDTDDDKGDAKKSSGSRDSWAKYVKPAWRKGYIKIRRYGRAWSGYVIGPKNEVLGHASNKINFVLGAEKEGPRIDPKLIRLIASVSDKFGGRELRIVSGYRTKSFVAASKHKEGKALDFSIPGIPNEALRDYLRTIKGVGVGYYPNSSFVHLDVRGYNSYWVDHAGPGQPPRRSPRTSKKSSSKKSSAGEAPDGDDGSDDDGGHDHSHGDDDESDDEAPDSHGDDADTPDE